MDFSLYVRVLWRFRVIVLIGLLLASSLAVLSLVRVGRTACRTDKTSSTRRPRA